MPSFDIVSKVDGQALDNAVNVTTKEITNRFDFKGSHVVINLDKKEFCRQRLFLRWFENSNFIDFRHGWQLIEIENYNLIIGIIAFKWDTHFEHYFDQVERW